MTLRTHSITLPGEKVVLRPLTEQDWAILMRWSADPDVLYFSEGDDVTTYTLDDVQGIYRSVSQKAFCFVIEADGQPVGDAWLQHMNLSRVLDNHPDVDCRRIDLTLAKTAWGQGFGTETIRLLTDLAFNVEKAHLVFGCDIADYNVGSLRAFEKVGFTIEAKNMQPVGNKAAYRYDLIRRR